MLPEAQKSDFRAQASISGSIETLHIPTSIVAEVFFGVHEERGFTPADDGVWDPNRPLLLYQSSEREQWSCGARHLCQVRRSRRPLKIRGKA